jgi:hypothetical protein
MRRIDARPRRTRAPWQMRAKRPAKGRGKRWYMTAGNHPQTVQCLHPAPPVLDAADALRWASSMRSTSQLVSRVVSDFTV